MVARHAVNVFVLVRVQLGEPYKNKGENMSYTRNGYKMIYMPEHHRAGKDGMVYEHIYLAEKYIGRPIEDAEEVHHEDEDRSNNSKDNLFVFKTKEDHTRYHHNGIMIKLDDGSHISPKLERDCKGCGETFNPAKTLQEYCSRECVSRNVKRARKVERPSKEELLRLISEETFVPIGKRYDVSDNAVRKWCKSYGLPYRKKDINMLTNA